MTKVSYDKYFKLLKENLPIIFFIPSLIGGFVQLIQLFIISPSLIRFLSISQIISDGLLILMILAIGVALPLALAFFTVNRIISRFSDLKSLVLELIIIVLIVTSLFSINWVTNLEEVHFTDIFYSLTLPFLQFFLLIFFMTNAIRSSNINKSKWNVRIHKAYKILRFFLYLSIPYFLIQFFVLVYFTINNQNELQNYQQILSKYNCNDKKGIVEILYHNDKYIFIQTKCEEQDSKLTVVKFDEFFEDSKNDITPPNN